MRDGSIDAFFWSGGVPTSAIVDAATTDDILLLATDRYLEPLRKKYGGAYQEAEIEGGAYTGVEATKTIGVPNLLMVSEKMAEELAHDITGLYAGKKRLSEIVPAAEGLIPRRARRSSTRWSCTRCAQRYYEEQR